MIILSYDKTSPKISSDTFIAQNAAVIGDVKIGKKTSIWYACTVRGDEKEIVIGERTNIQDNTVIHVATQVQGTYIGDDVTIGHGCIIHACTIGNMCLIGMGSIVMDGAKVEDEAMLAAGSLLTPDKTIPSGQLWAGRPAKFMRDLTEEDSKHIKWSSDNYIYLANQHTKARSI